MKSDSLLFWILVTALLLTGCSNHQMTKDSGGSWGNESDLPGLATTFQTDIAAAMSAKYAVVRSATGFSTEKMTVRGSLESSFTARSGDVAKTCGGS